MVACVDIAFLGSALGTSGHTCMARNGTGVSKCDHFKFVIAVFVAVHVCNLSGDQAFAQANQQSLEHPGSQASKGFELFRFGFRIQFAYWYECV